VAVSNGAAESAVCCDRDASGASFRFLVVDEEAVVRGTALQRRAAPDSGFARNVQSGRGERDGVMKMRKNQVDRMREVGVFGCVVYRGKRKDKELVGGRVVALRFV
jgi:hypothetical protein